jgi:hypothetical protein
MVLARIANPDSLGAELQELGAPAPATLLTLLGVPLPAGVDSDKPWFIAWAEDAETREDPFLILPLSDRAGFEGSLEESPMNLASTVLEDQAILGKGTLPELGPNPIASGFTGDLEIHVDLGAVRAAYAQEIREARESFDQRMVEGMEDAPPDPAYPGLDPASMGRMAEAELDLIFDILEQSEDMGISVDLKQGSIDWTLSWALEDGTPWGDLISSQDPKKPSGLGRVDLDRPVLFWMNHDLSGDYELLRPFFEAMSGIMKGLDPEVMSRLSGQQMEGVMSMGWEGDRMVMESVYSFPGLRGSEYRDLVREQMNTMAFEMPGIEMKFRENIGQIGDMEVDVLVQAIEVPEDLERPLPFTEMDVYYGWGEEEVFTVMAGEEGEGLDRLQELVSRRPGPVPDHVQELLDACPGELTLFGWVDIASLLEGFARMAPEAGEVALPEGLDPMVFYGTSEGTEAVYGGSMNIKALTEAASAMARRRIGNR